MSTMARWSVMAVAVTSLALSSGSSLRLRAAEGPIVEPKPGETKINPIDGAAMVWVPAGDFVRGMEDGEADAAVDRYGWCKELKDDTHRTYFSKEKVHVPGFWIYKYEVTAAQYRKFCKATSHPIPPDPAWGNHPDDHPVVNVTWQDATAYARWAGCSLPSETQWEYAALGGQERMFPWGDKWDRLWCNSASYHAGVDLTSYTTWKSEFLDNPRWKGWTDKVMTAPVGSFREDVSPFGCHDMAGNVRERCDGLIIDKWPGSRMDGPLAEEFRVLRGGSWVTPAFRSFSKFRDILCSPSRSTMRTLWAVPAVCLMPHPERDTI